MKNSETTGEIIGKAALEAMFAKPFHVLLNIKASDQLPIENINGFPAISPDKLSIWMAENGFTSSDPKTITLETLNRNREKRRIEQLPDRQLNGINEIIDYFGFPQDIIVDFFKLYETCPIQRLGRVYRVSIRVMAMWLFENHITWGHNRENYPL
jgi:hypothetical protein